MIALKEESWSLFIKEDAIYLSDEVDTIKLWSEDLPHIILLCARGMKEVKEKE